MTGAHPCCQGSEVGCSSAAHPKFLLPVDLVEVEAKRAHQVELVRAGGADGLRLARRRARARPPPRRESPGACRKPLASGDRAVRRRGTTPVRSSRPGRRRWCPQPSVALARLDAAPSRPSALPPSGRATTLARPPSRTPSTIRRGPAEMKIQQHRHQPDAVPARGCDQRVDIREDGVIQSGRHAVGIPSARPIARHTRGGTHHRHPVAGKCGERPSSTSSASGRVLRPPRGNHARRGRRSRTSTAGSRRSRNIGRWIPQRLSSRTSS